MLPKVVLSTAWVERIGFSDQDICQLFDIKVVSAVPANDSFQCPNCQNSPDDSYFTFYVYSPLSSPNQFTALKYIGCVCGTTYHFCVRSVQTFFFDQESMPPQQSP